MSETIRFQRDDDDEYTYIYGANDLRAIKLTFDETLYLSAVLEEWYVGWLRRSEI